MLLRFVSNIQGRMDDYVARHHAGDRGCPERTTLMDTVIVVWEVGRFAASVFFFSCNVGTRVILEKQHDRMSYKQPKG